MYASNTTITPAPRENFSHLTHVATETLVSDGHEFELCINSDALLRGNKCISILHNGSTYRLQATKLGKLILTK